MPHNCKIPIFAKVFAVLCLLGWLIPEAPAEALAPELEARLQATLKQDPLHLDDWPLYQATLIRHEALEPLLERLDELVDAEGGNFAALWLAASLHWRYGLLDDAHELFERASKINGHPLALFRVGQLLEASGEADAAARQFLRTLEAKPDDDLAERIRLRLALLKTTGARLEGFDIDLAGFAADRDPGFQNRAAIILALIGNPKQALELYNPANEGDARFKQQIRIAEWAMAGEDFPQAQEASWQAVMSAKLRRDRLYSLTVLAESYRRANSLDRLIDRFSRTPGLPAEAHAAWIDLLRERGKADEALALFENAELAAGGDGENVFTAGMRRELLEICREAGREDLVVENLRKMIAAEPLQLEWRSGLCRFHLERGDRSKGLAVWADFRGDGTSSSLLAAAGATMKLGLDELAISFAESVVTSGNASEKLGALQFIFDLHDTRGNEDGQVAALARMDKTAAPDSSDRVAIAAAWEQLGRQDKAAGVLENLRRARGADNFSADLETRLAWLYSETGDEEKALQSWRSAWHRTDSPGRRRYIEDRLMATASRLGKLARIAIELEKKLTSGHADRRDGELLVQLYTKVGDPVSASEIVQEFMTRWGGSEIAMLEEQARIYVQCNDYYFYENTIRKLMELDPEGAPEYYTQLAMSALERGRNDQARALLTEMRELEQNPASAEFEAGVLKIAGMHHEATAAYWRGVAQNPDRVDSYLLLGVAMHKIGKAKQAVGIFQYLVENADEDDLFTIAIDGLLNMNNLEGASLDRETLQWARRAVLERLAGKDDKLYLFQLLSDLSEELRDQPMMTRAIAETLPIAGERRTTQLRELIELSRAILKNVRFPPGDKPKSRADLLNFGRRLIGIGEAIPPQVYLDLGAMFLDDGDVRSAGLTFDQANENSDDGGYRRKIASTFKDKGYFESALRECEKLLIGEFSDAGLVLEVGELKEQLGRDDEAAGSYRRALDLLLDRQPLFNVTGAANRRRSRNIDDFDKYFTRTLVGFLATADDRDHARLVADYKKALAVDLKRAVEEREGVGGIAEDELSLGNLPRVTRRGFALWRVVLSRGDLGNARELAELLLESLPHDEGLLAAICTAMNSWGYSRSARELAEAFRKRPGYDRAVRVLGGDPGSVAIRKIFQRIAAGDDSGARVLLQDVDRLPATRLGSSDFNTLFSAARYLRDSAAIERLAVHAIDAAPKKSRLPVALEMLARSFPAMDQEHRNRLAAYVGGVLEGQNELGIYPYQYLSALDRIAGKSVTLRARQIKRQVDRLLARGGDYPVQQIAPVMRTLDMREFQTMLREVYRNAKSSDRATIIFNLLTQYPHKIDAGLETTFLELADEVASKSASDLLKVYRSSERRHQLIGLDREVANLGLRAKILEMLAPKHPGEGQYSWLLAQAQAWQGAGDEARALEIAKRLFEGTLEDGSKIDNGILRALSTKHPDTFLAIIDQQAGAQGDSPDLEQKRLEVARLTGDPERILAALRQAFEKHPEEESIRVELRQLLEQLGRPCEAIELLETLAKREPDNDQHRADLEKAWLDLAHPVFASRYQKNLGPNGDAAKPGAAGRASVSAVKAAAANSAPTRGGADDGQEQRIEAANIRLIKTHYEANQPDEARVAMRRLWRQFPSLDDPNRSKNVLGGVPDGKPFIWPSANTKGSTSRQSRPVAKLSGRGGLVAFLERKVIGERHLGTNPNRGSNLPKSLSLFEVVGSQEFAASEISRWLGTLKETQQQGKAFEDMLVAIAAWQVEADGGAEKVISKYLATDAKGELRKLDQHLLLAVLDLHPEAGGAAAASYLDRQVDRLDPSGQWKILRFARCLSKRGNDKVARSLYGWCGTNITFSIFSSHYADVLSSDLLVAEIREQLEGDDRLRALDKLLSLAATGWKDSRSGARLRTFILETWQRELPDHEVYGRARDVCEQIVERYAPNGGSRSALEVATLFLASGGNTARALDGFELVMLPGTGPNPSPSRRLSTSSGDYISGAGGSSYSRESRLYDYLLQLWLPEDMQAWTNADQWLAGIVERVNQWTADGRFPPTDTARLLSLVAVRQHQNGFTDAAAATLAELQKLTVPSTHDTVWISDAARLTGNREIAVELESSLLDKRRLPIERVAPLMKEVAALRGPTIALELAERASGYTLERELVETMIGLADAAGDADRAARWRNRNLQAWSSN